MPIVIALAELADIFHAADRSGGGPVEELLDLPFRPAGTGDDADMLWRQDDDRLPERQAAVACHGIGDAGQHLFRRVATVIFDIAKAAGGEHRDA